MRIALALLLMAALPVAAAKKPAAPKKPTVAQLQAQLQKLTEERDALKQQLAAGAKLQEDLAAARTARERASAEAEAARRSLEQLRATLKDNQSGADSLIRELKDARARLDEAVAENAKLKAANEELARKVSATPAEGALVILGEDIQPARPVNLNRVTPRIKGTGFFAGNPKGTVVVNVLVSEKGDVLAARLLQGLPGDSADARQAEAACVEAAKSLVFDPATSRDGGVRYKVWQGVGFYLE